MHVVRFYFRVVLIQINGKNLLLRLRKHGQVMTTKLPVPYKTQIYPQSEILKLLFQETFCCYQELLSVHNFRIKGF